MGCSVWDVRTNSGGLPHPSLGLSRHDGWIIIPTREGFDLTPRGDYLISINIHRGIQMESKTANEVLALIHDINSPLCALRGIIKSEERDKELEHEAYRRIFDLVGKLKNHYHDETEEEPCYLLDSLELSISLKEMESPKVVFSLHCQPSLRDLIINFKNDEFERAISNILINSCEAGATQVLIKISCNKDSIQMKITDNGIGFYASDIQQVQKRNGFTTKSNGTGVGLSSSIEFMKNLEGNLKILSTPYIGTNIILSFPKSLFDSLDYGPFAG